MRRFYQHLFYLISNSPSNMILILLQTQNGKDHYIHGCFPPRQGANKLRVHHGSTLLKAFIIPFCFYNPIVIFPQTSHLASYLSYFLYESNFIVVFPNIRTFDSIGHKKIVMKGNLNLSLMDFMDIHFLYILLYTQPS